MKRSMVRIVHSSCVKVARLRIQVRNKKTSYLHFLTFFHKCFLDALGDEYMVRSDTDLTRIGKFSPEDSTCCKLEVHRRINEHRRLSAELVQNRKVWKFFLDEWDSGELIPPVWWVWDVVQLRWRRFGLPGLIQYKIYDPIWVRVPEKTAEFNTGLGFTRTTTKSEVNSRHSSIPVPLV